MRVLNTKLMRDLRGMGGLLTAIASIVAVGVTCYVAMRTSYGNLSDAKRLYYAQCRMADFWIDLKKAPLAEVDRLLEIPGVSEIRPRIQFSATVDLEREPEPINAIVLSLPNRRLPVINDIVLVRGSYFTEQRANEVIVNEAFAREHGLRPGSWIHLLLNNRRQELFVVGTAISSEFSYLLGPGAITPDPKRFGAFYLKHSYAEEVFDFQGATNQVVGLLAPETRQRPEEVLRRAELILARHGVFNAYPLADQASNQYLSNEIAGLGTFGTILPLVFLSVAALVLNVLMTRLTEQQRTVVGTLKALGYDNRTILSHFIKLGAVVGRGGLVGCALGYVLAHLMTGLYRQFFEFPELINRFYPTTYLSALAMSLLCAVLGTLYGARTVLRLQPAEAMRAKPPRQGSAVWLEQIGWLWHSLSFGWRMVLRGVIRNRLRTGVGIFAAAMGASLLVVGLCMHYATLYLLEFEFEKMMRSDIDLAFKDEQSLDALREARRLPAVDYAEPRLSVACVFENGLHQHRGGIMGLVPGAQLTVPRDQNGTALRVPTSGLMMSRKMAEILHAGPGDTLTVRPIKGRRDPRQVTVMGIADTYLGLSVYADLDFLSRLVHEESIVSDVQLKTCTNEAKLAALYRELKQLPELQSVSSRRNIMRNLEETILQNQAVFIGMQILLAGVVFFGSILNASLINLAERQREVATLRVLGYSSWQVGGYFYRESLIVNLIGTALGLPLGYLLTVAMVQAYDNELLRIPVVSPPRVWFITIALSIGFGTLAHAVVQRSIVRMNYVEALQMKE